LEKLPGRRQDAIAQYEAVLHARPDSETARKSIERLRALEAQPAHKVIQQSVEAVEGKNLEPTSGVEPLTCRLRIGCSTN
jgi:hypothetical protein